MPLAFAEPTDAAIPLHVVAADAVDAALARLTTEGRAWAQAQGFAGALGQVLTLPDAQGDIAQVLVGYGTPAKRARDRFHMGAVARKLPEGTYQIASGLEGDALDEAALAWLLAGYSYDRYVKPSSPIAELVKRARAASSSASPSRPLAI
ncbi:MAG: hypothetical protein AAFX89_06200 [Pseudomonadota bacterium]